MKAYKELLQKVYSTGVAKLSRAGEVQSLHHQSLTSDLQTGFPALTGRKLAFKAMAAELECFIQGLTDVTEFQKRGCKIWDANLAAFNMRTNRPDNVDLGPIYGSLWRNFGSVDQLAWVLNEAATNPMSRRLVVSAWDPATANNDMVVALPPCHMFWQLQIDQKHIDLSYYMRSVDLALGLPFDQASYALLLSLIARHLELVPRHVTGFFGDAHIYKSNFDGVSQYLEATLFDPPTLVFDTPDCNIFNWKSDSCKLVNYQHSGVIQMEMAL